MVAIGWILATVVLPAICYFLLDFLSMRTRKRSPPGPKGLPILGNLHMLGKNPNQDLYHLAKRHGPIMYLQLGFVPAIVASTPEAAELCLKTHDLAFAGRPYNEAAWYVCYGQRNILFSQYGPYWRNMRKLLTLQLVSSHKINAFQTMRRKELGLFIESLKQDASNSVTVDLSASVSSLSANMSCLMVFGKKYMDKEFGDRGFKDVIQEALHVAAVPNLGDYFPFLGLLDLQGFTRRIKAVSKVFDNFLEMIIEDHLQSQHDKQTRDVVDTMMDILQSGEAEFEFDRRHVKAILVDMLVASMDTSATAVEWTLSELLRHPDVMKKLQKEIDEKVGRDRIVEEADLDNLEYLGMVVKESFRLHPPVPIFHHSAMEDCVVDGFHIQKNSRIMVNTWAIGRDPKAWPDPERFIPERFVGSNIDVRGHDFQFLPFGAGRRSCPGLQLGHLVVRIVLAQIVHCFDWELPNKMQPSDIDMSEEHGLVMSRAKHLMAVPTYRLNK